MQPTRSRRTRECGGTCSADLLLADLLSLFPPPYPLPRPHPLFLGWPLFPTLHCRPTTVEKLAGLEYVRQAAAQRYGTELIALITKFMNDSSFAASEIAITEVSTLTMSWRAQQPRLLCPLLTSPSVGMQPCCREDTTASQLTGDDGPALSNDGPALPTAGAGAPGQWFCLLPNPAPSPPRAVARKRSLPVAVPSADAPAPQPSMRRSPSAPTPPELQVR